MNCGDTFLTGDEYDEVMHLWIILNPPLDRDVVTVSITTRRSKSETLVIVQPGDHPFVKQESVIPYIYTRIRSVDDIEAACKSGAAKVREPASPRLLKKAQDGLLESDFTPHGVKAFFREAMRTD